MLARSSLDEKLSKVVGLMQEVKPEHDVDDYSMQFYEGDQPDYGRGLPAYMNKLKRYQIKSRRHNNVAVQLLELISQHHDANDVSDVSSSPVITSSITSYFKDIDSASIKSTSSPFYIHSVQSLIPHGMKTSRILDHMNISGAVKLAQALAQFSPKGSRATKETPGQCCPI
ncbi:hypothetical protein EV426DRAFT_120563 [Tirmania nivea]|nr:hypothetical protein EV426DRAFT_120563 [Tirmania nivea]